MKGIREKPKKNRKQEEAENAEVLMNLVNTLNTQTAALKKRRVEINFTRAVVSLEAVVIIYLLWL